MLQTHAETQSFNQEPRLNLFAVGLAGIITGAAGVTMLALTDPAIRKKVRQRAKEVQHALQKWSAEKILNIVHDSTTGKSEAIMKEISQISEEKLHN